MKVLLHTLSIAPLCLCFMSRSSTLPWGSLQPSASLKKQSANRISVTMQTALVNTLDDKVIRGPLQPVSNFILVRLIPGSSLTSGGIVLPDQSMEKPTEGLVVSTGPGRTHPHTAELIPMCVSPGDRVMFSKYAGKPVKYGGTDHSIIMDDDLLLVYGGDSVTPTNLKMIRDQVLVKLTKSEKHTDTGIAISAQTANKELKSEGQVVAVGPGRTSSMGKLMPCYVDVSEYVKFREYAGIEITIDAEPYSVVRMVDCLSKWTA